MIIGPYPLFHPTPNNDIGIPGFEGFGVGTYPSQKTLPSGMSEMSGSRILGHDNYGNYQFTDGSVMCWIPKFYYRIANASNSTYATYGVNSIDIKGIDTYASTVMANLDGYALHRAFVDGGVEKDGFFVDKYMCSKNAYGMGYVASSIKNGLPLSSAAVHNPFSDLTGGVNFYYSAIDLAHRRDGVNGDVNSSSNFFCSSVFIRSALALLSLAHGQAATVFTSTTTNCAWYHATYNFPKGCNNNALRDVNDTSVIWETDGYSNSAKTGSAGNAGGASNVFAKSTHNGQNCGVADLNGLMYEIEIGVTCDGTNFYASKQTTSMKTYTNGIAGATDHWGATGIAATMDIFTHPVITGNDGWTYYGNAANQVLLESVSGVGWLNTGLGLPKDTNAISAVGTNLFGVDGLYRSVTNRLCLLACGHWSLGSYAGVWCSLWNNSRGGSVFHVGFRAACYPV